MELLATSWATGQGAEVQAAWVRRWSDRFLHPRRVQEVFPEHLPNLVRILHPAHDAQGHVVAWSAIAAWSKNDLHPDSAFATISRDASGRNWDDVTGGAPPFGGLIDLNDQALSGLLEALCPDLVRDRPVWDGPARQPIRAPASALISQRSGSRRYRAGLPV